MRDKFVLWRFVGERSSKRGFRFIPSNFVKCFWRLHSTHNTEVDAIVRIDEVVTRSINKSSDVSWLITYNGKVVFKSFNDEGSVTNILCDEVEVA